jgi:hypothetical protein
MGENLEDIYLQIAKDIWKDKSNKKTSERLFYKAILGGSCSFEYIQKPSIWRRIYCFFTDNNPKIK